MIPGLDAEQSEYVRDLAYNAAHGAWAMSSRVRTTSKALLNGQLSEADQRLAVVELLTLAAHDPDHAWEAPTLTGRPTEYALAALEQINRTHA